MVAILLKDQTAFTNIQRRSFSTLEEYAYVFNLQTLEAIHEWQYAFFEDLNVMHDVNC